MKQKDLSVGSKLNVQSNQHWQVHLPCMEGKVDDPTTAFFPLPGKLRPQPHQKVNECDH